MAVGRVRVINATRVYWPRNCQMFDFKADEIVIGELADHLATSGIDVEILDEPAPETPEEPAGPAVDSDGMPDGTAAQILDWVDGDPARAAVALEAEVNREKPRVTLASALQKVAAGQPVGSPE